MKSIKLLTISILCMGQLSHAQFVYFNNLYEIDQQTNSLNYKILKKNNGYLNLGHMIQLDNNQLDFGTVLRTIDGEGNELQRFLQEYSVIVGASTMGNPNESVLQLSDSSIITYHGISNGMNGSAPYLIRFSPSLDTSWTKQILIGATPPDADGYANEIFGVGLTQVSDTSFLFLTYNRWGGSNEPDSIKLRYLTFNLAGDIVSNYTAPCPHYWSGNGVKKMNDAEYIIWGTQYFDGDRQTIILKTDFEGHVLDSLTFGNNDCLEGSNAALILSENGEIIFPYMRCLQGTQYPNLLYKPHVARIEYETFSIIEDMEFAMPEIEVLSGGAGFTDAESTPDGNYIALALNNVPGMNNARTCLIKLDANFNVMWQNAYSAGLDYFTESLFDVEIAFDGGYIASGTTEIILEDFSLQQKNWILKIDACGYEQPSGCPAVIGVDDPYPSEFDFQLWPNPCHNLLKARLPLDASLVRILDQTGRVVMEEKVFYPNEQWDVSRLCKGIYMIQVINEAGDSRTVKMVKE